VALVKRIDRLLNHEGYTIKGVQKLLAEKAAAPAPAPAPAPVALPIAELKRIRALLAEALEQDAA
jgi:DNA-binding transcriptional MerR regulator